MKLLTPNQLLQTSRVDHADWNYRPILSYVMRRRFAMVLALFSRERVQRVLEVGFGSGVFMPELASRCEELHGIDVHERVADVQALLQQCGVPATLSRQDAAHTDFPSGYFDVIVSVSTLEFVERIDDASRELARILSPRGRLLTVMPKNSPLLDFALRLTTGESAERDYGGRRERVLPALLKHFRIVQEKRFAPVYTSYAMERIDQA